MTKKQESANNITQKSSQKKDVLAAALRDNLMRRKNKSKANNKP